MVTYVGILNVTPDSFSDGGKFFAADNATAHARELAASGASIIDIGAQSTRPHAEFLDADTEWSRLEPVLRALAGEQFRISIDTFYPAVIEHAMAIVPDVIINDVTTAHDPSMQQLIAESGLTTIISHLPFEADGEIQTAHTLEHPIDDVEIVKRELLARREELIRLGARDDQLILDPGIGFGKTMRLSAELVEFARELPDLPVLIGFSRKRFIEQHLGLDRYDTMVNAEVAQKAIASGAAYLRMHDIPAGSVTGL